MSSAQVRRASQDRRRRFGSSTGECTCGSGAPGGGLTKRGSPARGQSRLGNAGEVTLCLGLCANFSGPHGNALKAAFVGHAVPLYARDVAQLIPCAVKDALGRCCVSLTCTSASMGHPKIRYGRILLSHTADAGNLWGHTSDEGRSYWVVHQTSVGAAVGCGGCR